MKLKLKLLRQVFANTCLLIVLAFGISFKTSAQAPYNPMASVDSQLRELFSPLCHPTPEPLFLYDMAVHTMDSIIYTDNCPDTLYRDVWYKMYEEFRNSAYDTTVMIPHDSVYTLTADFSDDTNVVNVMVYDYLRFNDSALSCNYYFTADTTNNVLIENGYPCELNPYLTQRVFAVCPSEYVQSWSTVTFRVDPAFIFHDNANDFISNNRTLKIDFGDGTGFHIFPTNSVSHHTATYGFSGKAYVKAYVYDLGNPTPIMRSLSEIIVTDVERPEPDTTFDISGAKVSFWYPCEQSGGPLKKTIIYVEGIDHGDVLKKTNRNAWSMYHDVIQRNGLNMLLNFGYQFAVVDWHNSRRDIKDNAYTLEQVIMKLKCDQVTAADTGTHQQFIIMAESMGGLVSRYAMCEMEQSWSTLGGCLPEKMHNTRLLITLDAPNNGANIPLAIQHLYRNTSRFLFGGNTITQWLSGKLNNSLLDATSAKQMLLYHVDTYNPFTEEYSEHNKRTDFKSDLNDIGNYPQYAKLLAISSGSLKGIGQTHVYDTFQRTPNDYLMDLESNQWIRVFGNDAQLLGTNLELRTTPNGNGTITTNTIDFYRPKVSIKIKSWKLKVVVTSAYWYSIGGSVYGKNLLPYDVAPGSVENYNDWLITKDYQPTNSAFALLFGMNHPTYNKNTHTWTVNTSYGGGKFAFGRSATMYTDGMHWCFMPTISALDYSGGLYENIEDENIVTKTSANPFDVIVGFTENWENRIQVIDTLADAEDIIKRNVYRYHTPHLDMPRYRLGDWQSGIYFGIPDTYPTCEGTPGGLKYWLNREIGDDSLFVENRETAWTCIYDAERYIGVNQRNIYYQYPYISTVVRTIPGMYSKRDDFAIASGTIVIFMTRDTNDIFVPTPQYDDLYLKDTIPWVRCCPITGSEKRGNTSSIEELNTNATKINGSLTVYPNPTDGNEIFIRYKSTIDDKSSVSVYNQVGQKMFEQIYNETSTGVTTLKLNVVRGQIPSGLYIVRLKNGGKTYQKTIVFQ